MTLALCCFTNNNNNKNNFPDFLSLSVEVFVHSIWNDAIHRNVTKLKLGKKVEKKYIRKMKNKRLRWLIKQLLLLFFLKKAERMLVYTIWTRLVRGEKFYSQKE